MVGTTASGVRTGQTGEREPSRQSLRAPKVVAGKRAVRRIFTSDDKLSVLAEYDRCSEPGERGALLRREGLYSSLITDWRRQHREAPQGERGPHLRRRAWRTVDERSRPASRQERTVESQAGQGEAIIEVQGNVQALLDQLFKSADNDDS